MHFKNKETNHVGVVSETEHMFLRGRSVSQTDERVSQTDDYVSDTEHLSPKRKIGFPRSPCLFCRVFLVWCVAFCVFCRVLRVCSVTFSGFSLCVVVLVLSRHRGACPHMHECRRVHTCMHACTTSNKISTEVQVRQLEEQAQKQQKYSNKGILTHMKECIYVM